MRYVVKPARAAEAFRTLRDLRVHPHFPGYLAVVKASLNAPAAWHAVDFKALYDAYLRVEGGPTRYVNALLHNRPTTNNAWRNDNIAGSYAPSSIRDGQPFERVVALDRTGDAPYRLKERHWETAREALLFGRPLPVVPLTAFLYRDLAFESDGPSLDPWVRRFQEEFGYLGKGGKPTRAFSRLYTDDRNAYNAADWVESYEGELVEEPEEEPDEEA